MTRRFDGGLGSVEVPEEYSSAPMSVEPAGRDSHPNPDRDQARPRHKVDAVAARWVD
jgi:hypothetical protein